MGRFFVIEEQSPLPRWLRQHLGAYLPPKVQEEALCGAEGSRLIVHDMSSPRAERKLTERLRAEQSSGTVCGIVGADEVRLAMAGSLEAPLCDGQMLCTALRLAQITSEADCGSLRITLRGADSALGQAAAVYLARRVRFLSLDGRRTSVLNRLSRRLWQTEGIAARVGSGEDGIVLSAEELASPCTCVTAQGRRISSALAECALLAGENTAADRRIITAGTLEKTAQAAHFYGIGLLPKKDTPSGKFD